MAVQDRRVPSLQSAAMPTDSASVAVTATDPTPPPPDFLINAGITDAWYYPVTDGQGFFIIVWEDIQKVFLAWFTYDVERPADGDTAILGEPGHRWITAQGPYLGDTATLAVSVSSGGVFDSGVPPVETVPDGTIELQFSSCTEGMVTYEIDSLGLSGAVPIQRIVLDNVPACEAAQSAGKSVSVCGEVAADHEITPLLIGLGVQGLSMNASSILEVRNHIRNLSFQACQKLARAKSAGEQTARGNKRQSTRPRARNRAGAFNGPALPCPKVGRASGHFFLSALTSTVFADMVYSIVTLAPTLRSPVTLVSGVRATSHFSLPFWTTILVAVTSSTGPVTW